MSSSAPKKAQAKRNIVRAATENCRLPRSRRSSSGCFGFIDHHPKAAMSAAPMSIGTSTSASAKVPASGIEETP